MKRLIIQLIRAAAVLALGAEAVLRGGVSAASHDLEAVRAVRPEARGEATIVQRMVRSCRDAVLSSHLAPADDAERLAAAVRGARCSHHVEDGSSPDVTRRNHTQAE